jgi:hypothetical protein
MRTLIALTCLAVLPAWAQDKPAAAPKKPVAKAAPVDASASRLRLRTQTAQVASGIRAAEAALSPEELEIAQRVHQGKLPCELGAYVQVTADAKLPGYFDVHAAGARYRMVPVATSTGAIRLEDARGGAVWLQLANKSMLMNQKQGRRLADECRSAEQAIVAEAMLKAPPVNVLEPDSAAPTPTVSTQ